MLGPAESIVMGAEDRHALIDFNRDLLARHLKGIVAQRQHTTEKKNKKGSKIGRMYRRSSIKHVVDVVVGARKSRENFVEQVAEAIDMPKFDETTEVVPKEEAVLDALVLAELEEFVVTIADKYHGNFFHNLAHAHHVVEAMSMLLSRLDHTRSPEQVYQETHGIATDALTQFALVFSALIHDVDHCGVPNATLVKEKARMARRYDNESVLEQNSFDFAWHLFQDARFARVKKTVCATSQEEARFRQTVINVIMATDICNANLRELRQKRWEQAFLNTKDGSASEELLRNLKATSVLELFIQVADVSHTMQSFETFVAWNERLFLELSQAYVNQRADKDPADFWAKGEIGFFDFYIIPLAEKLRDCGILGSEGGDEFVQNAIRNRDTWKVQGEDIVEQFKVRREEYLHNPKEQGMKAVPSPCIRRNSLLASQA